MQTSYVVNGSRNNAAIVAGMQRNQQEMIRKEEKRFHMNSTSLRCQGDKYTFLPEASIPTKFWYIWKNYPPPLSHFVVNKSDFTLPW